MGPSARLDLHLVRVMLRVPAALAALATVVAFALGEGGLAPAFLALGVAALGLDLALRRPARRSREAARSDAFSTGERLASVALAWALVGALGTLPFRVAAALPGADPALGVFESALSSLFESVSGFTSTGLTMVDRPSELPATLQLWRSLIEWVGGVGLALVTLILMNPERDGGDDVYGSELSKPLEDDMGRTAREVWAIYLVLSAAGVGLFAAAGMPWWEALNHGMTAIATGGFSVTDDSFASYGVPVRLAAVAIMLAGAISFAAWRDALERRRPGTVFERGAVRVLLGGVVLATALLWLARRRFGDEPDASAVPFEVVSAFATAGFSSVSLEGWHPVSLAVLIVCMAIGGTSGATTGGLKTDRVLLLGRGVAWRFRRLFRAEGTSLPHRVSGERRGPERARVLVESAATLVALWFLTALVGCVLLAAVVEPHWSFTQVAFEVMSAQGGVGLSVGIATEELAASGKWVLVFLMWAGRLELIAAFALLCLPFVRVERER